MKRYFQILILLGILFVVPACNDEFLDTPPLGTESEETFYKDFESLDYTANAAYGILCARQIYDHYYYMVVDFISDDVEAGGDTPNDAPHYQSIDRLTHNASTADIFLGMWGYGYKGIRMTNEFLSRVDKVKKLEMAQKSGKDLETVLAQMKQRTAEMKFLRAFYHFTLAQYFGGIPVADHVLSGQDFTKTRDDIATVLHFVENDLHEAIPDLPLKSQLDGAQIGRATQGAAQALLAKVYLYESSYAENYPGDYRFGACEVHYDSALNNAERVINSAQYNLLGLDGERYPSWRAPKGSTGVGGYRALFTTSYDNCVESVWEIQNVLDNQGWDYTRGQYHTVFSTVRYYRNFTNPTTRVTTGGWSFNCPTEYVINAFGNADTRESNITAAPCDPTLDPRFSTTVGREGDTILVQDGTDGLNWYPMDLSNLATGTICRKYECSPAEYWSIRGSEGDMQGPMNIRLIRYADVLLMASEAALKRGDNAKALTYINLVRQRARNSGETGYPVALPSVTLEDIMHERRLELTCEGTRYFDLVRWGKANQFIDGVNIVCMGPEFILDFVEGKHEFMPVPIAEVQATQHAIENYPPWQE